LICRIFVKFRRWDSAFKLFNLWDDFGEYITTLSLVADLSTELPVGKWVTIFFTDFYGETWWDAESCKFGLIDVKLVLESNKSGYD
jgi:hypothetical protein